MHVPYLHATYYLHSYLQTQAISTTASEPTISSTPNAGHDKQPPQLKKSSLPLLILHHQFCTHSHEHPCLPSKGLKANNTCSRAKNRRLLIKAYMLGKAAFSRNARAAFGTPQMYTRKHCMTPRFPRMHVPSLQATYYLHSYLQTQAISSTASEPTISSTPIAGHEKQPPTSHIAPPILQAST